MHQLNKSKVGMTLGAVTGLVHLVWSFLVGVRWAQPFLDFIFGIHMIQNPYIVQSFSFGKALALIVVTAIVGYIVGLVFASIWNKLHTA